MINIAAAISGAGTNGGAEIISRAQAIELGLKWYFTGEPCKHGHISERSVSGKSCKICAYERTRRHHAKNRARLRAYDKKYRAENREGINRRMRERYINNREQRIESARAYRREHPDKTNESSAKWKRNNAEKIKAWKGLNPESHKKAKKKWNAKNGDKIRAARKTWYYKNHEKMKLSMSIYQKNNRHIFNAGRMRWKAAKLRATPAWADYGAITSIYKLARETTTKTGMAYHVDRIVPLQGKTVCGLHVENNLRVLLGVINSSKQNRYWPDM